MGTCAPDQTRATTGIVSSPTSGIVRTTVSPGTIWPTPSGVPVAMMSPANTYVCLTEGGPGCDGTEPDKYYPSGSRNYARVVAHDAYQGAAVAEFM